MGNETMLSGRAWQELGAEEQSLWLNAKKALLEGDPEAVSETMIAQLAAYGLLDDLGAAERRQVTYPMGSDPAMAQRVEGGPEVVVPSIEDLIKGDPLTVHRFYTDADLEEIAKTRPDLVDDLAEAYVRARLGVDDAS